jgi:hypothetical protein
MVVFVYTLEQEKRRQFKPLCLLLVKAPSKLVESVVQIRASVLWTRQSKTYWGFTGENNMTKDFMIYIHSSSINGRGVRSNWCTCLLQTEWLLYIPPNLSWKYRSMLKRMQLTCTTWTESLNTRNDGWGKTYRCFQKHESITDLSTGRHLLFSFITSLKSNLCTLQTTQNTTGHNCIILHAQNTTALQPHIFFSRMYWLLVTHDTRSSFPSATWTANSSVSTSICILPTACSYC